MNCSCQYGIIMLNVILITDQVADVDATCSAAPKAADNYTPHV